VEPQRNANRFGSNLRRVLVGRFPAVMVAVLLPITMHAQAPQDPLSIGADGKVRIQGNVGINAPAVEGQNLHIAGSADSIPLNITDPSNSVNWLSVLANGNVLMNGRNLGIGVSSPEFPLTFSDKTGDKISLNGGDFGFGVAQDKALQIHSNANSANIVFGWGKSDALTELMRIKGTGEVGIGTPSPKLKLDVNGAALFRGNLTALPGERGLVGSSSALYFTDPEHTFTAFGDPPGLGAIENSQNYQSLMILGRTTASSGRVVRLWDRVGIAGSDCTKDAQPNAYKEDCTPQDALDVNGNVRVRNNLYVYQNVYYYDNLEKKRWIQLWGRNDEWLGWKPAMEPSKPSDSRLKSELQPIPSALDKVNKLRGVTYRWNGEGLRYLTRDIETTISAGPQATVEQNQKMWQREREKQYKELGSTQVGVVAQDVEAVLPEAVTTDKSGYKSVRYDELIPLLIEAVKELESKVKEQSQLIVQQQKKIADLSGSQLAAGSQQADLAAVRSQLAVLQATVQRLTATQLADAPDVTNTSGPKIH
jgi:Chaperone of endosialidase